MRRLLGLASTGLFLVCPWAAGQRSNVTLRITSPKDRAVITPGKSVTVEIAVRGKLAPPGAIVAIGQEELGVCYVVHPPYTCSIAVKSNISPVLYSIVATNGSEEVISEPIYVDVERDESPVKVELDTNGAFYCWLDRGPRELPSIYATYRDGARVDVSRSTRITFTSEDPNIARVVKDKRSTSLEVIGIHAGSTRILVNHRYPFDVVVEPTTR